MSKGGKKAKASKGSGEDWPFYDFGPLAIAIGPHPDDEEAFGLFIVVGETGFTVADYDSEEAARAGSQALDEAIETAAKEGGGHIHEEACDQEVTVAPSKAKKPSKPAPSKQKPGKRGR
jgi:hypothetical protein